MLLPRATVAGYLMTLTARGYSVVSELDHWTQLTAASPNDSVTLMVSSPQWSFVDGYRRVVSVNGRCVSVTATCYRLIELGVKIRNRRCLLLYM